MGLTPKKFRQKQLAEQSKAKAVNKDPLTKKEVKTDDLPSKKTLMKRMKARLDEGEEGIEEALQDIKREEKRLKRSAQKLDESGNQKPTKMQRKINEWEARAAARGNETAEAKAAREVYVGNLNLDPDQEQLRLHFAGCGEITDVRLLQSKSSCSAFVAFKNQAAREAALKLDGSPFDGQALKVGRPKGVDKEPHKPVPLKDRKVNAEFEVMIGGIPYSANKRSIRRKLRDCGQTARVMIPFRTEGKQKGCHTGVAIVAFKTAEGFQKAIALNGTTWRGATIRAVKNGTELKTEKAKKDVEMGEGDDDDEDEEEEEEDDEEE